MKPTLLAVTKHEWIDGEKIPATGGCVVVVNHISHLDPMTLGLFLYDHGRLVRYLTKDALFRRPGAQVHRQATPGRSRYAR